MIYLDPSITSPILVIVRSFCTVHEGCWGRNRFGVCVSMSICFQSSGLDSSPFASVSRRKHSGERNSQEQTHVPALQIPSPMSHLVDCLVTHSLWWSFCADTNGYPMVTREVPKRGHVPVLPEWCLRKPEEQRGRCHYFCRSRVGTAIPFVGPAPPLPPQLTSDNRVMHHQERILWIRAGKTSRFSPPFLCQAWNSLDPLNPF